jgi:hypothetical protein
VVGVASKGARMRREPNEAVALSASFRGPGEVPRRWPTVPRGNDRRDIALWWAGAREWSRGHQKSRRSGMEDGDHRALHGVACREWMPAGFAAARAEAGGGDWGKGVRGADGWGRDVRAREGLPWARGLR